MSVYLTSQKPGLEVISLASFNFEQFLRIFFCMTLIFQNIPDQICYRKVNGNVTGMSYLSQHGKCVMFVCPAVHSAVIRGLSPTRQLPNNHSVALYYL